MHLARAVVKRPRYVYCRFAPSGNLVITGKDVRQHSGRCPAYTLEHGDLGIGQLVSPRLAGELLHNFTCLVEGGGADGMSSRFQAAHGADGQFAFAKYLPCGG